MIASRVIQLLLLMFNPQRKSKLADIYMQQRAFQLHVQKMNQIRKASSPLSLRYEEESAQKKYLEQLHLNKQDIKARKSNDLYRENHRMFLKLMEADTRPQQYKNNQEPPHRHHNHYYILRNEEQRIKQQNSGMINRLVNKTSFVPTLQQMKRDFSQSKRYGKMVRKLPTILKHEELFKRELSLRKLNESRPTLNASRHKMESQRTATQEQTQLQPIEQALLGRP